VTLDDGAGAVQVDGELQDRGPERVGAVAQFFLAFLIEEFAWSGGAGRGPTVVHATYWSFDLDRARPPYAAAPVARLYGSNDDRTVIGDADTLIVVAVPEPAYVCTRTGAALLRARERFGEPRPEDVRGPG
jgi:hypothetical protein